MRQLTAAFVRTVTVPGKYGDQHGLVLRVTPSGSKQWIWRGTIRGKRRDLGFGGYPYTSLAEARQIAFEYRKLARSGGDPTALRRNTTAPSFAEACEQVIAMHEPSWKDGGKSADSWRSTLRRFAYPRLGDISVAEITSEDVLAVVAPVWQTRRETARKLKGRISAVMAWAIAEGHRPDDPTAAVIRALPRNGHQVQHHQALPHSEVAAALATVQPPARGPARSSPSGSSSSPRPAAAKSAAPAGRDRQATRKLWTVPAERAKNTRPHRVPLSAPALDVLTAARNAPRQLRTHVPQPHRAGNLQRHHGQTPARQRHRRRPPRIPQQLPRLVRRNRRRPRSRRSLPRAHRRRRHRSRLRQIRPASPARRGDGVLGPVHHHLKPASTPIDYKLRHATTARDQAGVSWVSRGELVRSRPLTPKLNPQAHPP